MNGINVLGFLLGTNWYSFEVVLVSVFFQSGIKLWGRDHKLVLVSLLSPVVSWWLKEHCVEKEQLVGHGKDEGGAEMTQVCRPCYPGSASHLVLQKFAGFTSDSPIVLINCRCVNQMTFGSIDAPQISIIFPGLLLSPHIVLAK